MVKKPTEVGARTDTGLVLSFARNSDMDFTEIEITQFGVPSLLR